MSKPKFKNNRKELSFEEEYVQLMNDFESIHKLLKTIKMGQADSVFSIVFSRYRALLCNNGRNFNPLLIRVMDKLEMNVFVYTSSSEKSSDVLTDGILNQVLLSKQWSIKPKGSFKKRVNFKDYLKGNIYFNPHEDRYISREDLIRLISDSEGAHFDTRINLYSEFLDNSSASFNGIKISQKELFMWDIYFLIEWIVNQIEIVMFAIRKSQDNQTSFEKEFKNQFQTILERNDHYDTILTSPLSEFRFIGYRICDDCNSKLIKIEQTKYECSNCKKITEL